ncbi:alanine racemase [Waltera intestinalis]|jgi:alanine racemase|uniref:Alanine racemase n=1 Tax=Waltera intestinalis TaxID=2606635 RepID=A0A6L5YJQ0_9FIRM|nr:alanine racemase [Waltera intestinalis]MCI6468609.1 alanine racemase [Lachnospiraceae bacterium]MST57862.1 alanine racemase [Waltera intestinalis]
MTRELQEKLESYQRVWAEVDLDAIWENMVHMKENIAENTKILAVIKTDGYGHGGVPIAKMLEQLDFMFGYAAATYEEAHVLREAGVKKPILILGYTFPYCYEELIREEIRPAVYRRDTVEELVAAAAKVGQKAKVHIKVDTGMGRIGITPDEEGLEFVRFLMGHPELEVEGIFTHFAKSDEEDKTSAYHQLALFQNFIDRIQTELGLTIPVKHCSNSAAILEMPQANMDMVRAGITTYGLYPSEEVSKDIVPLRAAMSLYSHIVYCKTIHAGQSVSYGGLFTAQKDTRVATIPVGYGDGYPRSLSGKGYVLIRGKKAPILGRVCMDQFMVDISEIPGVMEGDKVTLLGVDGTERITAEELGELSGRFNYEFVCDLGKRIPRVYRQHGEITEVRDYFENF